MDLRDLRYFETIAELQHLGRACERLHRSQPALTSAVRRLEEACGATLFEKAGRGIRLTEAGRVLLRWARRMRFDVEDARRELSALGAGLSGQVRLGIVPTAAQFLLPQAARQLLAEAPAVSLRTVVALVDALRVQLREGALDLVVGSDLGPAPDLVSQRLAEDTIVVAANQHHPIFRGQPTLADLVAWPWALQQPGAPTRDWLDHTFDRAGLPRPRVQVESSMLLVLPALIAESGLLSFISRRHLQRPTGLPGLREVPVPEAAMQRHLVVMHRADAYLSPAARRLVELLRQGDPWGAAAASGEAEAGAPAPA